MGRRQKRQEQEIDNLIAKYVTENEGAADLRDIQDYINGKLGVTPSTATIAATLRALGLEFQTSRWVYSHNPQRY